MLELPLFTDRCILKRIKPENAEDLLTIYGDSEVMKYMQMDCVSTVEECAELISRWDDLFTCGVSFRWGVFLKDDPSRMAGTAALHYWSRESRRIELGADLHREFWGRGIITEVTRALIDCAFNVLEVNRIEIRCHPGNTGSVVIADKLGFVHEGTLREYVFVPGKGLVDEAVYSLLAGDQ